MTGKLDGKVAIITGVASGIGLSTTQVFIREGAQVLGVDRDQGKGELLAEQWPADQFSFLGVDLETDGVAEQILQACLSRWQRVDILFNCAGISQPEPFLQITPRKLQTLMAVNFFAPFLLCQQAVKRMRDQGGGIIINVASELALVGHPDYAAYCGTKGAILSFTRALALECAPHNIRVNAICPGPIDTPMLQGEFNLGSDPDQVRQQNIDTMPIGRLGEVSEIAQVVLFLAADAPVLMQGANIVVDGGKTIL